MCFDRDLMDRTLPPPNSDVESDMALLHRLADEAVASHQGWRKSTDAGRRNSRRGRRRNRHR